MVILSDILTLNELVETTLEALGKVVDPATITTQRGLMSNLDLGRGGLTVVRDINDIKPYESGARFDVADLKIQRLQTAINQAFYVDQLELKDSPAMTATEVNVRYELMQRLMGPTLGRMQDDFLDPLIERTFRILYRKGSLPEMPAIVAEQASELDIEYTGPLPRSQKMETARSVQEWVGGLAQMSEAFPEVLDIPNVDEMARGLGHMSGVPAKFIHDVKTVQKRRQQRAEKRQLQEGVRTAQETAEAAKTAGEARQAMNPGDNDGG
jgi:hypothetical protein